MAKRIGLLTSGSDCPGENAVIRAIGKAARCVYNMDIIGFQDGFKGLIENDTIPFDSAMFSGILTAGGTILGTSRDRPHEYMVNGVTTDLTDQAVQSYRDHKLDVLVCIGGRETNESAQRLMEKGLNVITIPKAIDNDVENTDLTIGFNTAVEVAAQSVDRVHSTAYSHHRILIVEMMGKNAGWLTLGAGIAGGADVILIPEIPYDIQKVSEAIMQRSQAGKRFSIVAVAERIVSQEQVAFNDRIQQMNSRIRTGPERERVALQLDQIEAERTDTTFHLANRLEDFTGLETRVIILDYLLRGGSPSASDRMLATQMGTACVSLIQNNQFGVMVSIHGEAIETVPLEKQTGEHKTVPLNHPWITSADNVGTNLGR